jgi:hypothetical protein
VPDTTPTSAAQTEETYLGSGRANNYAGDAGLNPGTSTFTYPASVPADTFALSGAWSVTDESLTAVNNAAIALNFQAADVYLDVGGTGTGTVTATVDGKTTTYEVSGAPNIYALVSRKDPERATLHVAVSPGLDLYSFTFG